jgi:hypothetical protein
MAIASTDLITFGATDRPLTDLTSSGGTVTVLHRPVFTEFAGNTVVAVVSTGADTRVITVTGRNTTGAVVADGITLTGAVEAVGVVTFERIQTVIAASTHASNTVIVRMGSGGATVSTIPAMELGFYRMFLNSASDTGPVSRYEKIFWKNTHATLTLNAAKVKLTADPSSRIKIGLAASKNDVVAVAVRTSAPGGVSFVDDNIDIDVPGTTLEAGSVVGVWVEQALLSSDSPFKSSFTTQLAGTSI